ncbi:NACHT domain-containing protein [Nocardia sp. bgisy134]|uniref:NACHT domain-containing protein n=1 Tax=Nocardia sp. bgisy134 TaxID=3413789 RepID=UPI003D72C437
MSLETDDAVDDIRIDFESGHRAYLQAKRSLEAGASLKKAVAQWIPAVKAGLCPEMDRLVIVTGTLNGPTRNLQGVLNRNRTTHPGPPTEGEAKILSTVHDLLDELSDAERELVLKCAVIWELQVEEQAEPGAQLAMAHLRAVVADKRPDATRTAWESLMNISGRIARLRGGHDLAGWSEGLRGTGVELASTGDTPAAVLETRRLALKRYCDRLIRQGTEIDLRMLGAELPNLLLAEADADVTVTTEQDDNHFGSDLIGAFLRRGRVVLTGLPGGGKTTALKHVAAQLAQDPTDILPVRASLREINTAAHQTGFRERLVAAAVRDERVGDQEILTQEINRRLDGEGGIALLLDALDETYNQRGKVISELYDLVADLPDGVCILVTTRDVAYGQAATLGWPALRLRPPSKALDAVTAVLEAAAKQKMPVAANRSEWVSERVEWVQAALAQDELLHETPLIPTLLALLAAQRSPDLLPKNRAKILEAVVKDMVATRETARVADLAFGPLEGDDLPTATMEAFTSEAAAILNSQGRADKKAVMDAVAAALGPSWGLPPARANIAAAAAVRLFDETGIFVASGADETVAPRIALFAEIGDAMRVVSCPNEVPQWVEARVASEQFEPLVLACTLNSAVARVVYDTLRADTADVRVAKVLAQASSEGATLDDDIVRGVCQRLIAHIAEGTSFGWSSWKVLLSLPIPSELRASAEAAAAQYGTEHNTVARASLEFHFYPNPTVLTDQQVELLKEVLAIPSLPDIRPPAAKRLIDVITWSVDQTLIATQERAARLLLDHDVHTAPLIAACAAAAPSGLQDSLVRLLTERGLSAEVQPILEDHARGLARFESWLSGRDNSVYGDFLSLVADHEKTELSTIQAIRLDELADFIETLDLNDGGAERYIYRRPDAMLRQLIGLTVSLYGFDHAVLAAEAEIALARMKRFGGNAPYFALFDNAQERSETDWSAVSDPDAALLLLLAMLTLGIRQARFAAKSLWRTPVAHAAELLREQVSALTARPGHQRLAASALASLESIPEPECWVRSDNPVLRVVAALTINPMSGDESSGQIRELLDDLDGHVQEAVIKHIVSAQPSDLMTLLKRVVDRQNPGWMCLNCRTANPPSSSTRCSKDDCSTVGPNPGELASKHLATKNLGRC